MFFNSYLACRQPNSNSHHFENVLNSVPFFPVSSPNSAAVPLNPSSGCRTYLELLLHTPPRLRWSKTIPEFVNGFYDPCDIISPFKTTQNPAYGTGFASELPAKKGTIIYPCAPEKFARLDGITNRFRRYLICIADLIVSDVKPKPTRQMIPFPSTAVEALLSDDQKLMTLVRNSADIVQINTLLKLPPQVLRKQCLE